MLGLWLEKLELVGFKVKNTIVWDKVVHGLNYQNYAYTYELIIFAVKGSYFPKNKIKDQYKDIWHLQRKIDNRGDELHHETVKLLEVVKIPIVHASNEGDLICDPFIGSGTTAVACKQLNRKFIGIEIEQKYCDIAKKRLEQSSLLDL